MFFVVHVSRIGFAIAKRLAEDGAKVVISSRKQKNVDKAVELLKKENLTVLGMPCHVGLEADRQKLIEQVESPIKYSFYFVRFLKW
jgi:dehydrogenase/reductase SDR family member 4